MKNKNEWELQRNVVQLIKGLKTLKMLKDAEKSPDKWYFFVLWTLELIFVVKKDLKEMWKKRRR